MNTDQTLNGAAVDPQQKGQELQDAAASNAELAPADTEGVADGAEEEDDDLEDESEG